MLRRFNILLVFSWKHVDRNADLDESTQYWFLWLWKRKLFDFFISQRTA